MNRQISDPSNQKPGVYYGYVIVIASFFIMVLAFGSLYCFGVFFKPMLSEFGWSRATTSGPFALSMVVAGSLGILSGRLSDKIGSRKVVTFGSIILGLGLILTSRIGSIWQLYLFYGVVVAAGLSMMYIPVVSTVTRWFPVKPGLMTGISIAGIGLGVGVVPPLASRLIVVFHSWRASEFFVGITTLVLILVSAQFLKQPHEADLSQYYNSKDNKTNYVKSHVKDFSFKEALQTGHFWLFCLIWFCYGYIYQVALVHIVPYATDIHMTDVAAAAILTIIGIIGTFGRVILGVSADRFTNKVTLMVSMAFLALAYLGLTVSSTTGMLYGFSVIYGFFNGVGILAAPIVAEYFGARSLGIIVGAIMFANNIGGAVSPPLAGSIFDNTGSYRLAFLSCVILGITASILFWKIKPSLKKDSNDTYDYT